jgi:hypothetical protein
MDWNFPIVGLPRRVRLAAGMAVILALSACMHTVCSTEANVVHEQATQTGFAVPPQLGSGWTGWPGTTSLQKTMERGHFDHTAIQLELDSGADLTEVSRYGTALDFAVKFRLKDGAEFLLKRGAQHADPVHTAIARHKVWACIAVFVRQQKWLPIIPFLFGDGAEDLDFAVFWHNNAVAKSILFANKDAVNSHSTLNLTTAKC